MQDFVRESNIKLFRSMIGAEIDPKRRAVLQSLLDKETRSGAILALKLRS